MTVPLAVVLIPVSVKASPEDIGGGVSIGETATPQGEATGAEFGPDPLQAETVKASTTDVNNLLM